MAQIKLSRADWNTLPTEIWGLVMEKGGVSAMKGMREVSKPLKSHYEQNVKSLTITGRWPQDLLRNRFPLVDTLTLKNWAMGQLGFMELLSLPQLHTLRFHKITFTGHTKAEDAVRWRHIAQTKIQTLEFVECSWMAVSTPLYLCRALPLTKLVMKQCQIPPVHPVMTNTLLDMQLRLYHQELLKTKPYHKVKVLELHHVIPHIFMCNRVARIKHFIFEEVAGGTPVVSNLEVLRSLQSANLETFEYTQMELILERTPWSRESLQEFLKLPLTKLECGSFLWSACCEYPEFFVQKGLTSLSVLGFVKASTLGVLKDMFRLSELNISIANNNDNIDWLRSLVGTPIRKLSLYLGCSLDLSALQDMPLLADLSLTGTLATAVNETVWSHIEKLPLTSLSMPRTRITEVPAWLKTKPLTHLSFACCDSLKISIKNLPPSLVHLNLERVKLPSTLTEQRAFREMKNLEVLDLSRYYGMKMKRDLIDIIVSMPALTTLSADRFLPDAADKLILTARFIGGKLDL